MTKLRSLAALVARGLLASACSGGSSGGSGSSKAIEGGEFRWGTLSPIDSLNPFVAVQQNSYYTFEYVYPFLVQYDANLRIVPDFATSWQASPDGETWTFHTRPNAKWSDGSPLSSTDAAWTITTVLKFAKGPTASVAGNIPNVTGASATTPDTLVIHYSQPTANALEGLQQLPILPQHVWATYATGSGAKLKTFANAAPIVSGGPFVLQKYLRNRVALFQRNPNWWGPKPHVEGFGIEFFSDADTMVLALKNDQIDGTEGEPLPPTATSGIRSAGLTILSAPAFGLRDFIINSNPRKTQNRELLNPQVREAFAHAIDRNAIVKTAWLGAATAGDSIISPAYGDWHDSSLHPESFDLSLANQELDQAGYTMGSGGLRVANGHPMKYTVLFVSDESGPGTRALQIISDDFRKIGVELDPKQLDPAAAENAILGPNNSYQGWDLAMWDWAVLPADPAFILNALTCSQLGGWSDTGYCNKTYDALYQKQSTTLDHAARVNIVDQMQQQIYNDRPYIILTYDDWTEAHSPKWAGFVMSPDGSLNALSIATMLSVHKVA
jgi:peptide/nickel transport system substrate-binding protein